MPWDFLVYHNIGINSKGVLPYTHRDKNKPIITSTFPYMQKEKGNPRGCNPIFIPLNRQTIYYIIKRPLIPKRPEKMFFQEMFLAQTFFWVALACGGRFRMSHTHTHLCLLAAVGVTLVGFWSL